MELLLFNNRFGIRNITLPRAPLPWRPSATMQPRCIAVAGDGASAVFVREVISRLAGVECLLALDHLADSRLL